MAYSYPLELKTMTPSDAKPRRHPPLDLRLTLLLLFAAHCQESQAQIYAEIYNGLYNTSGTTISNANTYFNPTVGYGIVSGTSLLNDGVLTVGNSTITSGTVHVGYSPYVSGANTGSGYFEKTQNVTYGTLTLQSNTVWNQTYGSLNVVGNYSGTFGTENINTGSSLSTGWNDVGESGVGVINVTGGSHLITGIYGIGPYGAGNTLGFLSSGDGTLNIDGAGSSFYTFNNNIVGVNGTGAVNVSNGGVATTQSTNFIGSSPSSNGYGAPPVISGSMHVLSGGVVQASQNELGYLSNGNGVAVVDGVGSKLISANGTVVGGYGTGTLTVQNGGLASAVATLIGASGGSHGAVSISGDGSVLETGALYIGGRSNGPGGVGLVTINGGGTVEVSGITQMYSAGTMSIVDGTLINNGTFNNAGTLTLGPGAVLAGSGVYNGSLTIADGTTLAPGNSPGTMTFNGDQTWGGGGNLDLQLLNTTGTAGVDWDKLLINGVLNLTATPADPFVINLATLSDSSTAGLLAGFDPFSSYQWLFLTASSITGFNPNAFEVNTADFWNVFSNGTFGVHQDGGSMYLDYHAAFVPPPTDGTVTPEPTSLALAGCAGLGMAVGAWRRRRLQKSQAA